MNENTNSAALLVIWHSKIVLPSNSVFLGKAQCRPKYSFQNLKRSFILNIYSPLENCYNIYFQTNEKYPLNYYF